MSKLRKILLLFIVFMGCCCNGKRIPEKNDAKEISIGLLMLDISSTDTFIQISGIDSRVGFIITPERDTFHLEYGKKGIIYTLFEVPPKHFQRKIKRN
jgi:hypothetical protein